MGTHNRMLLTEKLGVLSRAGARHSVTWVEGDSGHGVATNRWTPGDARVDLELNGDGMTVSQASDVYTQFLVTRGSAFGFRCRDWSDWSTHPDHNTAPNVADPTHYSVIAQNQTGTETVFPLVKNYGESAVFLRDRRVTKPIPPGWDDHVMALQTIPGSVLVEGTHYTVDYDHGVVKFVPGNEPGAPGNPASVLVAFTFHVPMRFAWPDPDSGLIVDRDGPDEASISNLAVEEVDIDFPAHHDEWLHGGYNAFTFTGTKTISFSDGLFQDLDGSSSPAVKMPDSSNLTNPKDTTAGVRSEPGFRPYFFLRNVGSNAITVLDVDGAAFTPAVSLGAGQGVECLIFDNSVSNGWKFR